ncbi:hypothetical protein F444_20430, partial [Phytophthora nicotianae P1976]
MALQGELKRRASASATKFITARVAFSPANEPWMDGHLCRNADATFLIGIVSSYRIVNEVNGDSVSVPVPMFKIRWTSTAFQTKHHIHEIDEQTVIHVRLFVRQHDGQAELTE